MQQCTRNGQKYHKVAQLLLWFLNHGSVFESDAAWVKKRNLVVGDIYFRSTQLFKRRGVKTLCWFYYSSLPGTEGPLHFAWIQMVGKSNPNADDQKQKETSKRSRISR